MTGIKLLHVLALGCHPEGVFRTKEYNSVEIPKDAAL